MCELCSNSSVSRATLVARADQVIAGRADVLRSMVATYRRMRAEGRDLPLDIGAIVMTSQATYSRLELSQLLAVAIDMLAKQEPRTGGV